MLWFYRLASRIVMLSCYLYGRRRAERGDLLWKGRLGLLTSLRPGHVWLHAASVGEVKVSGYLVAYLLKRKPALRIHLTTMTRAGFNSALKLYSSPNVSISYCPLDSPSAVRRTFDGIRPRVLIIAETEIWPNLVCEAHKRGIPVILINGRMTEKACRRYRWVRSAIGSVLKRYERFFFKTQPDADRYRRFGVDDSRAVVAGDMKFDAPLLERTPEIVTRSRALIGAGPDDFVLVAGSTRPGEETVLADVFAALKAEGRNIIVVIAPRHIDRIDEIRAALDERQIGYTLIGDRERKQNIILVDRVGLLNELYLGANLAFVGGTLADIGGHNILEPVWAGCPVLFGPSIHNVREAADYIIKNSFGATVHSGEELLSLLKKVADGDIMFQRKQDRDLGSSPTAGIGDYILKVLSDV
ncbi:MAG: hypothetical protein JSW34_00170 [Candidatus Zixiibacteriota bacterium]|nr:MAG: hypothetical protein JSW34_00170 [candidate division Zixibacteria bacterium]